MRVLYIEGVAIHGGPESCVGVREGVGEALTGGVVGGAIEPRNPNVSRVPTLFSVAEGDTAGVAMRESLADPARSENPGTHADPHAREPGGPVVGHGPLMMLRPRWFTGWQIGGRVVREGNV